MLVEVGRHANVTAVAILWPSISLLGTVYYFSLYCFSECSQVLIVTLKLGTAPCFISVESLLICVFFLAPRDQQPATTSSQPATTSSQRAT